MNADGGNDIQRFLARIDHDKPAIVQEIRGLVRETIPDSHEDIKWGTLTFEREKIIGAIKVHKNKVNL